MHTRIIGPHRVVLQVDRAVEKLHVRMADRAAQDLRHHRRGNGEHRRMPLRGRRLHGFPDLFVGRTAGEGGGLHLREARRKLVPPQLVPVDPGGGLRRLVVEEGRAQRMFLRIGGTSVEQLSGQVPGEAPSGLLHLLRRLHESQAVRVRAGPQFILDPLEIFADLRARGLRQGFQRIDLQIEQESVAAGDGQVPPVGLIGLRKIPVGGAQALHLFLRPVLREILSHRLRQLLIAAGFGHGDPVDRAHPVELQEFVVDDPLLRLRPRRAQPDDVGQHLAGAHEAEDGDAFISLLHIKPLHVFVDLDGIPDPLLHLGLVEGDPFRAELRFLREQRHEIPGERALAPAGAGPHHHGERDLDEPHGLLGDRSLLFQEIVERRQIRVAPREHRPSVGPLSPLFRFLVIFVH